jgi:hypothetical protein
MAMVVVCHAVIHPWTVTAEVSFTYLMRHWALTGHFSQHTDRTSCNAYYVAVCVPCNSHRNGVRQIVVAP